MSPYLLRSLIFALRCSLISGWLMMACHLPAHAEVIEETVRVAVKVEGANALAVERQMVLTIVRDDQRKKAPYLIIHHGRPENPARFAVMGQQKYPANANYFVAKGFVVLIPTRIGYGLTGGPDVEYAGECGSKKYLGGVAPIVSVTQQILAHAEKMPYVNTTKGIVMGESYGGIGAIAVASSEIKSVTGVINISGGDGGSLERLDKPCSSDQLSKAFAQYGKTNHLPSLWMYSLNDRYWGVEYPKQWFAAFTQAGGQGEFVSLPADKNNGHYIFTRNAEAWHPAFEAFIRKLGF